jgi:hypothetical protein
VSYVSVELGTGPVFGIMRGSTLLALLLLPILLLPSSSSNEKVCVHLCVRAHIHVLRPRFSRSRHSLST